MNEPTHEELRAVLQLAHTLTMEPIDQPLDPTTERLARAVLRFGDAVAHYERCITWDSSCMRCGRLLDACYAAERRADEAEAALAVALARRASVRIPVKRYVMDESASWEERYRQLETHHTEETTWLLDELKAQGRTPPEPVPPGTTIADLLRLPDDFDTASSGLERDARDAEIRDDAFAQTVDHLKRDGKL